MMKNIKVLDCTLRDGGRIFNCAFPDAHIKGIVNGLTASGVDYVEMGFLRGNVEYRGNSTFFNEMMQIDRFIPENRGKTKYVVFVDYGKEFGMWDFGRILPRDKSLINGFRIACRKENLREASEVFKIVKDNGYKLFIQGVESLHYSNDEMLKAIEFVNQVQPDAFGIVDTYGAMYKDDILRLFGLVNQNLDNNIAIDFHSHNNMQLSFSFAQEIIECNNDKRCLIIDSSLDGIGKGAGNLNTELLVDYLNRKYGYNYNIDNIFDTIDEYISWLKDDYRWGYQIPYFMAGIYSAHPNNIIYLTEKHRMSTKDIKYIISMIDPATRKRYDYDNIERLYVDYFNSKTDDSRSIEILKELSGREILVLVPGHSLDTYKDEINTFIKENDPIVITVNFIHNDNRNSYAFFGNQRRYQNKLPDMSGKKIIVTSNAISERSEDIVINFNRLIERSYGHFDNSTIMLLNLLKQIGAGSIIIAGFDGFDLQTENFAKDYLGKGFKDNYQSANTDIETQLRKYAEQLEDRHSVRFLTPSRFSEIFD